MKQPTTTSTTITFDQRALASVLSDVTRATARGNLPAFSHVLIQSDGKTVAWSAFDGTLAITRRIPAPQGTPAFSVLPHAKVLTAAVGALHAGPLLLEIGETSLTISGGGASVSVPCIALDQWPTVPAWPTGCTGSDPFLATAISKVAKHCIPEEKARDLWRAIVFVGPDFVAGADGHSAGVVRHKSGLPGVWGCSPRLAEVVLSLAGDDVEWGLSDTEIAARGPGWLTVMRRPAVEFTDHIKNLYSMWLNEPPEVAFLPVAGPDLEQALALVLATAPSEERSVAAVTLAMNGMGVAVRTNWASQQIASRGQLHLTNGQRGPGSAACGALELRKGVHAAPPDAPPGENAQARVGWLGISPDMVLFFHGTGPGKSADYVAVALARSAE